MISPLLLLVLAAPAHPGPPPNANAQRQALTHCLSELVKADLQTKTAADAFTTKANAACVAEEASFRSASIIADRAVGIRPADAEQNAKSEIADLRAVAIERYKDNLGPSTPPH
ncbi:MAG TPA: hypothetical protein VKI45_00755 [Allosphingosinicella sp.]|nr:hypothetical protein [Allosphingosinicella sp.]